MIEFVPNRTVSCKFTKEGSTTDISQGLPEIFGFSWLYGYQKDNTPLNLYEIIPENVEAVFEVRESVRR